MSNITRKVLLLASYCGNDNPGCTDDFPCDDCLKMCNVCEVDSGIKPIGGFGYLKGLIGQPQEDVCEWVKCPENKTRYINRHSNQGSFSLPETMKCPVCGKPIKVKE